MCAYDGSHIYNTCWNLYFYFSPHYFKHIKVSALALLKMVMHSRSGGNLEVMGLLLGKVDGNTMIVMDSFALPVEGTETRVNAQAQAYEYMAAYTESAKQVCQKSNLLLTYCFIPILDKLGVFSDTSLIILYVLIFIDLSNTLCDV